MKDDIFLTLKKSVNKADREELDLVAAGKKTTMLAYKKNPGKGTKAFVAARELYDETVERLSVKYAQDLDKDPESDRFKNRKQALLWLRGEGYQISQGKFYQDCDAGFPRVHKDKTVSKFEVLQYGQRLVAEPIVAPDFGESQDLKNKKLKLDVERLERDADRESGRWLLKEEAWGAIATLFSNIQDSLKHHFNIDQGKLVYLAGGDHARSAELYEACEELIVKAFNDVCASDSIVGVFEQEKE